MFGTVTQHPIGGSPVSARPTACRAACVTVSGEGGFGMVSALLALSLLAVFALVAAAVAVNERRSSLNEELHTGAFMSADSGGEAAINWLRARDQAPPIVNWATKQVVTRGETTLYDTQRYQYDVQFLRMAGRRGYSSNYFDYTYNVDAQGAAGVEGQSNVGMVVNKLTRQGY